MDASMILRAARHQTGLSQRDFAGRAGIALRTLEAAEAGHSQPTWRTVQRALDASGLSLCLAADTGPPSLELQRFLSRTTADRTRHGLFETRLMSELKALCATGGVVHLPGLGSVPTWVPGAVRPSPLLVHLHRPRRAPTAVPSQVIDLQVMDTAASTRLVRLHVRCIGALCVTDPIALSLEEGCAAHAQALRAAARCLHDGRATDAAGRQAPAHREPDEKAEYWRLYHHKKLRRFALPNPANSRAWRLGGEVGVAQWLAVGRLEKGDVMP